MECPIKIIPKELIKISCPKCGKLLTYEYSEIGSATFCVKDNEPVGFRVGEIIYNMVCDATGHLFCSDCNSIYSADEISMSRVIRHMTHSIDIVKNYDLCSIKEQDFNPFTGRIRGDIR